MARLNERKKPKGSWKNFTSFMGGSKSSEQVAAPQTIIMRGEDSICKDVPAAPAMQIESSEMISDKAYQDDISLQDMPTPSRGSTLSRAPAQPLTCSQIILLESAVRDTFA